MRGISPKLYITAWTLVLSSLLATSFGCNSQQAFNDPNIYQTTVCELAEKPDNYDGKRVSIKAIHGGLGTDTPTYLNALGCDEQIWVTCEMDTDSCVKMYDQLRSIGGVKDLRALPQISVTGRFKADAELRQMSSGSDAKRGKLFEITELKGIETVRN